MPRRDAMQANRARELKLAAIVFVSGVVVIAAYVVYRAASDSARRRERQQRQGIILHGSIPSLVVPGTEAVLLAPGPGTFDEQTFPRQTPYWSDAVSPCVIFSPESMASNGFLIAGPIEAVSTIPLSQFGIHETARQMLESTQSRAIPCIQDSSGLPCMLFLDMENGVFLLSRGIFVDDPQRLRGLLKRESSTVRRDPVVQ